MYPNKLGSLGEMEKFLEATNLPQLYHEELENVNRSIISKEIELLTKTLPTKKRPGSNDFTGEFHQKFQEELIWTHYGDIRKPGVNRMC